MADERANPDAAAWAQLGPPHLARYLFAGELVRGKRVLDAGCGTGYGASLLLELGAEHVTGVDVDEASVAAANARYPDNGAALRFVADDCQTLANINGEFDVVTSFECIEHLPEPARFLAAAARVLTADGVLIVSTPDRASTPPFVDGRPRNQYHHHEWYADEFAALLREQFDDVTLRMQIESFASLHRRAAVEQLRRALTWANPLSIPLFRKLRFGRSRDQRPWKQLDGLAAASHADFPIMPAPMAPLFGESVFHVALCRRPRRG